MSTLGRVAESLKREGISGFTSHILRRARRAVVRVERVAFFETDLGRVQVPDLTLPLGVTICEAQPLDYERFAVQLEKRFGMPQDDIRERLARGHTMNMALYAGEPVSMQWYCFDRLFVSEVGRTIVLNEGEASAYGAQTLLEWRGRGLSPAVNLFAWRHLPARGVKRTVLWRRVDNIPAMRLGEKLAALGQRRTGTVTAVFIAGLSRPCVLGQTASGLPKLI